MKTRLRTLKLFAINALTLVIGIGLISASVSSKSAQAARFETIPSLQIKSLGNYRGQYLTVLYAIGSRPFIATDNSQINISQIKESRTVYITNDSMTLPAVQVKKEGFRPAYNLVVLVVSPKADFGWVNADGSLPQGSSMTNNKQASVIDALDKSDIDDFSTTHKSEEALPIELKRSF